MTTKQAKDSAAETTQQRRVKTRKAVESDMYKESRDNRATKAW